MMKQLLLSCPVYFVTRVDGALPPSISSFSSMGLHDQSLLKTLEIVT